MANSHNLICPIITSQQEAKEIGAALTKVAHMDRRWAEGMFTNTMMSLTYSTGPALLNRELQSMWDYSWSPMEKKKILTEYIAQRLSR